MTAPAAETWRLEIHGRPGWFVPAFEASFPVDMDPEEIQRRLWRSLSSFGYGPLEDDEELRLSRVEPWRPCASGQCRR